MISEERQAAQERVYELLEESYNVNQDLKVASGIKLAREAKRIAKTHNLLMPYLRACFHITNDSQSTYECQSGIDEAIEIISYLESEDRARKFQSDYDPEEYAYTVHWLSACGYDNLGKHTAEKNGYNSPLVHGAVDDGFHICRRTGKLECIDCFREYATEICVAADDLDMAFHYANLCLVKYSDHSDTDRRWVGQRGIASIHSIRGNLDAAIRAIKDSFSMAEDYHSVKDATWTSARKLRLYLAVAGKSDEFEPFLQSKGVKLDRSDIPDLEENPSFAIAERQVDAVEKVCQGDYTEAVKILSELERFLAARDALNTWFDIRKTRIAAVILAKRAAEKAGVSEPEFPGPSLGALCEELRAKAEKACQWSSINALNAMLRPDFPVSPLAIPAPLDIGPFAPEGVTKIDPVSSAAPLPLVEKPLSELTEMVKTEEEQQQESSEIYREYDNYFKQVCEFADERSNAASFEEPYPKEDEFREFTLELVRKTFEETTPQIKDALEAGIVVHTIGQCEFSYFINSADDFSRVWNWAYGFLKKFPDSGRLMSSVAMTGMNLRSHAESMELSSDSFGLPSSKELTDMACKAFELRSDRYGVAYLAGLMQYRSENNREAGRYLSRACQLDRTHPAAVSLLGQIYKEEERPRDALAVYDLFIRAGGRTPSVLFAAGDQAIELGSYPEAVLYLETLSEEIGSNPLVDTKLAWAQMNSGNNSEAIKLLDEMCNGAFGGIFPKEILLVKAFCEASLPYDSWKETLLNALKTGDVFDLPVPAFEIFEKLWNIVSEIPEGEYLRDEFERQMLETASAPNSYFYRNIPEPEYSDDEDDDFEEEDLPVFECRIKQPISVEHPGKYGWITIPETDPFYWAMWYVAAHDEEEAGELASAEQARCHPYPSELVSCEKIDSRPGPVQILAQGRRYPPQAFMEE